MEDKQEHINSFKKDDIIKEQKTKINLLKLKLKDIKEENKKLKEMQEQFNTSKNKDIQKDINEINLLKEKEEQIILSNNQDILQEQDKNDNKFNEKNKEKINGNIKLKYLNCINNPFNGELERNNKSMDIEKFISHQEIFNLENQNNLLKSENNFVNKLMEKEEEENNLLDKVEIKQDNERHLHNIFNLNINKNKLENENKSNRIVSNQKNKIKTKFTFDSKKDRKYLESNSKNKKVKSAKKERFFLDMRKEKEKNDENAIKINNFNKLNSSEKDEKNKNFIFEDKKDDVKRRNEESKLNLLQSIENDNNNKEKEKEKLFENNNKEKSEENGENNKLKEESNNLKEQLQLKENEIERLKKDLMINNQKWYEGKEKMNKKSENNNELIIMNEKLNKEKESLKEKLEKSNIDFEKIIKENIELNDKINNLKKKNEELQKDKEIFEKINKEKEEINYKLQKEKEKNKEIDNLKIENNNLNENIKEEMQKTSNLNKKNIELMKENENIKLVLNKSIEEKKNLIKEKEKLNEINTKNKILILQYDEERNDLISKKNVLENQLNELLSDIMNNNPLILYNKPTSIGLNNIGATCFMNSTLQCLSQTKELTSYFLRPKNKDEIIKNNIALENMNNNQLCPVFLELIQKLWERNGPKSFSPNKFMNTVNEINSLFKTGQAGDAKDFIIFVLEQLHKELKKPIKSNNILNSEILNQYDKNNSWNHFFKDFKNELSIISDIFYGINETTNECLNCKNIYNFRGLSNNPICYNYGIFNCLIFPLEEVKNFKYNNNYQFNNFQINNCVSIYDCFCYNQKTELFTGQNRNYCNICKQLYDSYYTSKIYASPTVLILILNRGKGNIFNIKIFFDEIIDITEFVLQKENSKIVYNLYGVITHIGQSGPNAHFVASCKSPIDNKWYRYNDSFVNPIENIQKEIIDFGTPYILFYHKQNS